MKNLTLIVAYAVGLFAGASARAQSCFYPESQILGPSVVDIGAQFGSAVAIDGDIAVVGAPYEDTAKGASAGTAYVYERVGGSWSEAARLTADDGHPIAFFGSAVAVSGSRVAVASIFNDANGLNDAGAVYIFEKESGGWQFKVKLIAADASAGSMFGASIALESDQLAIGAAGYCYVFENLLGTWFQTSKLYLGNFPHVDIEPNRIIASGLTIANIYEKQGATWSLTGTLQGSGPATSAAARVSLSGDRAMINSGDWRVYVRQGNSWSLEFSIDNAGDYATVAIRGETIAIGFLVGHLQVWRHTSAGWNVSLTMETTDGVNNGSYFSTSLALDGSTAVVGAPLFSPTDIGRAYVLDTTPPFDPYGSGCPGTGGFVPELSLSGCATSNGSVNLDITKGLGGSFAVLLLGLGQTSVPLGSGCTLLLSDVLPQSLLLPLFGTGAGGGAISVSVGLPPDLLAGSITLQGFIADTALPIRYTVTNGVALTTR